MRVVYGENVRNLIFKIKINSYAKYSLIYDLNLILREIKKIQLNLKCLIYIVVLNPLRLAFNLFSILFFIYVQSKQGDLKSQSHEKRILRLNQPRIYP